MFAPGLSVVLTLMLRAQPAVAASVTNETVARR
jgi:hypothetical protein